MPLLAGSEANFAMNMLSDHSLIFPLIVLPTRVLLIVMLLVPLIEGLPFFVGNISRFHWLRLPYPARATDLPFLSASVAFNSSLKLPSACEVPLITSALLSGVDSVGLPHGSHDERLLNTLGR